MAEAIVEDLDIEVLALEFANDLPTLGRVIRGLEQLD